MPIPRKKTVLLGRSDNKKIDNEINNSNEIEKKSKKNLYIILGILVSTIIILFIFTDQIMNTIVKPSSTIKKIDNNTTIHIEPIEDISKTVNVKDNTTVPKDVTPIITVTEINITKPIVEKNNTVVSKTTISKEVNNTIIIKKEKKKEKILDIKKELKQKLNENSSKEISKYKFIGDK